MPHDRFVQIKRSLRFSDDAGDNQGDTLHKIRFILDNCRDKCQSEYTPHREISMDEALIPFKGRLRYETIL